VDPLDRRRLVLSGAKGSFIVLWCVLSLFGMLHVNSGCFGAQAVCTAAGQQDPIPCLHLRSVHSLHVHASFTIPA